jgi:hypothetical protein
MARANRMYYSGSKLLMATEIPNCEFSFMAGRLQRRV